MKPKAVIFDIDGTLADIEHRRPLAEHKDWTGFFLAMVNDGLNVHVANALKMYKGSDYKVILVTGRPADYLPHTVNWIKEHGLSSYVDELHMRKQADYRGDDIVKEELYTSKIKDRFNVEVVYDDRDRVVQMWRKLGIPCFQVAEGDF